MATEKYSLNQVFIKNSPVTQKVLRGYITRHNVIPYVCKICGCDGSWQNGYISLELHHEDGDNSNNDQYNLGIASQNGNEYLQQNEMQNPTGIYGNIVNYANSNSTMTFADQQVINNYGDALA